MIPQGLPWRHLNSNAQSHLVTTKIPWNIHDGWCILLLHLHTTVVVVVVVVVVYKQPNDGLHFAGYIFILPPLKTRVVIMLTLASLAAPRVVVLTSCSAASDYNVSLYYENSQFPVTGKTVSLLWQMCLHGNYSSRYPAIYVTKYARKWIITEVNPLWPLLLTWFNFNPSMDK